MPVAEAPLKVALLEDDPLLREHVLLPGLRNFGFAVNGLHTAAQLHAQMRDATFDLVILDVGLPDGDGFELTRQLRRDQPGLGIIMLTARGQVADRVRGLSEGADAYLPKPVELDLLAATLYSVARRLAPAGELPSGWRALANGWSLQAPNGTRVPLTKTERRLVARLLERADSVVSREELIEAMAGDALDFDPHRLDSMIHRLRRKVVGLAGLALPLSSVHGEGYVLAIAS